MSECLNYKCMFNQNIPVKESCAYQKPNHYFHVCFFKYMFLKLKSCKHIFLKSNTTWFVTKKGIPSPHLSLFLFVGMHYDFGGLCGASLVDQLVKNLPAMWETWVWSLGWEGPPEKGKASHSGLGNSMDCIVHGVAESDTTEWLSVSLLLLFKLFLLVCTSKVLNIITGLFNAFSSLTCYIFKSPL